MTQLDLDDTEEHMFRHAASGYGAEVAGGTPDDREDALREYLDDPFLVVDGRDFEDTDAIIDSLVIQSGYCNPDELDDYHITWTDAKRGLERADVETILFLEFDSLPSDTQTSIAQLMKGVAEHSDFDGCIGYSVEDGGSVVKAEFDLASRVRTWDIDADE